MFIFWLHLFSALFVTSVCDYLGVRDSVVLARLIISRWRSVGDRVRIENFLKLI